MLSVVLFVIAIIAAIIHLSVRKKTRTSARKVEIFLAYILPLSIGVMGIVAFAIHSYCGHDMAMMHGWPKNCPIQNTVALASLALGITGLLCLWQRRGFWLATAIVNAIFVIGVACEMMMRKMPNGKVPPMTETFHFYIGFILIPLIILVLSFMYAKEHRFFKG